jgi:hypothetical protein
VPWLGEGGKTNNRYVEAAAFETFASKNVKSIRLHLKGGEIVTEYD